MPGMSWHQQRAAGMHRLPGDIVGYDYNAERYCPGCVPHALTGARYIVTETTTERWLDRKANELGINRDDESSYDQSEFPKVVFRSMLAQDVIPTVTHTATGPLFHPHHAGIFEPDRCASCGEVLGE